MKPKSVIAHLYLVGLRPSDVARDLKVSRTAVSKVIYARGKSRRVAMYISKATKIPVSKLWPGRYDKAA